MIPTYLSDADLGYEALAFAVLMVAVKDLESYYDAEMTAKTASDKKRYRQKQKEIIEFLQSDYGETLSYGSSCEIINMVKKRRQTIHTNFQRYQRGI